MLRYATPLRNEVVELGGARRLVRRDGLSVLNGAAVHQVLSQHLIATDGAITGVEDAVITPGGRIFVQLRTERNGLVLIESGPAPGVMIQAGDPLPVQLNRGVSLLASMTAPKRGVAS